MPAGLPGVAALVYFWGSRSSAWDLLVALVVVAQGYPGARYGDGYLCLPWELLCLGAPCCGKEVLQWSHPFSFLPPVMAPCLSGGPRLFLRVHPQLPQSSPLGCVCVANSSLLPESDLRSLNFSIQLPLALTVKSLMLGSTGPWVLTFCAGYSPVSLCKLSCCGLLLSSGAPPSIQAELHPSEGTFQV